MYQYRSRYYSPAQQRFASEDRIGLSGGLNLYSYVGNAPVSWIDPLGQGPKDKWWGYNDRDFQDWFHRHWKSPGDPDATKQDIEVAPSGESEARSERGSTSKQDG